MGFTIMEAIEVVERCLRNLSTAVAVAEMTVDIHTWDATNSAINSAAYLYFYPYLLVDVKEAFFSAARKRIGVRTRQLKTDSTDGRKHKTPSIFFLANNLLPSDYPKTRTRGKDCQFSHVDCSKKTAKEKLSVLESCTNSGPIKAALIKSSINIFTYTYHRSILISL